MGYIELIKLSKTQLEEKIRKTAAISENVFFTDHARDRMALRDVTRAMVEECLRKGKLTQVEPNASKGSLECRMECYCAGKNLAVVAALQDEDPSIVTITVIVRTKKR